MRTEFAKITGLDLSKNDLIINAFKEENQKLKYFIDSLEIQNLYIGCYDSIEIYFTQNKIDKPRDFNSYIYKAVFLFQSPDLSIKATLKNFDKFVNKFINNNNVLKSFLSYDSYNAFDFPNNTNYAEFDYNVDAMRTSLKMIGYPILKNIQNLPKIQNANQGNFPKKLEEFKQVVLKVKFPLAEKNTELAKLVNHYNGDNEVFEEILNLMDIETLPSIKAGDNKILASKAQDNLPNVTVKYTNPETKSQYHLVKLPNNDFRTLMLGDITGNCQTLTHNDADPFIIDGITRPNNGFYVIIKEGKKSLNPTSINWNSLEKDGHEIIGQSYAWIGRDGKAITWEAPQLIKDRAPNIDIKEILNAFGEAIAKEGFDRVTIGRHDQGFKGAKNFTNSDYTKTNDHNIIMEGVRYHYSSTEQYEVYVSEWLTKIRKELNDVIGKEYDTNSIISTSQGETLVSFFQDKTFDSYLIKILISPYLTKNWNVKKIESILSSIKSASPEQLELILNDSMQKFYKHGMTIEYALKMSCKVLSLLISLPSDNIEQDPMFLQSGINLDDLVEEIVSITSIDQLHRKVVKLMAKQLCNDIGDLEYVDTMSLNKVDFLVNDKYLSMDILSKKHYTIRNLSKLDNEKFDILRSYYYIVKAISKNEGVSINNFIDKYDSTLTLKQDIFKFVLKVLELTIEDNIVDNLSPEKLDLLLSFVMEDNIVDNLPEKLYLLLKSPNYNDPLETAKIKNTEDLKYTISLCLEQGKIQDNLISDISQYPEQNPEMQSNIDIASPLLGQNLAEE